MFVWLAFACNKACLNIEAATLPHAFKVTTFICPPSDEVWQTTLGTNNAPICMRVLAKRFSSGVTQASHTHGL